MRFHDEVRVKKIKAKGRSMPVSSMYDPEEDDDEDDGLPAFEDGWDEEEGVWEDEDESDDADELDEDGQSDEELPEDDESAQSVNETMDRFKDDLFADDDEAIQQGIIIPYKGLYVLPYLFSPRHDYAPEADSRYQRADIHFGG